MINRLRMSELILKKKPQIFLAIGKPDSGKSHLVKSIVFDYIKADYFKFMTCYCKTKFTGDYSFIPDDYVYEGWDEKRLKKHVDSLAEYRRKHNKKPPPSLIILDDLLGLISFYTPFMTSFITCHRHYNVSIIFTAQYLQGAKSTSTTLREITNVAFVFNSKFKSSLKALYEAYGQLFDSYDDFVAEFQRITREKYHCMVYDSSIETVEDNYIDFVAPEHTPEFQLKFKI
jgi:hypothetical protein